MNDYSAAIAMEGPERSDLYRRSPRVKADPAAFFALLARCLRLPASLGVRFLLFAILMTLLVIAQGVAGWTVVDRNREMTRAADEAVAASMADLDLLRTIKNMQVQTLVTQNLVSTASTDDPTSARLDIKKVGKDYLTGLSDLTRNLAERHMTTLGGIKDLPERLQVAKDSFDQLESKALEAVADADKDSGKIPPALMLEISARVDGLYEHLDRMAEGVNLMSQGDRKGLTETIESNGRVLKAMTWIMSAAAAAGLLGCLGVTLFVGRGILRPLTTVAGATRTLAEGNLDSQIPQFRATEIAAITGALAVFRENLAETARLKALQESERERQALSRKQAMEQLADQFDASVRSVVETVTDEVVRLRTTADLFSRAAEDASLRAGTVASASEEAASNVNTVAAAAEELSASIRDINSQVGRASDIAGQAVSQAVTTSSVGAQLMKAAERIGTIVNLIADIAHRTHLLSLNATIEASRAGEAGRGFAVVANEVKTLAGQTAQATAEVSSQVETVQSMVHDVVRAIDQISGTIGEISSISDSIAVSVDQQGIAAREISQSIQKAAMGTQGVSANIAGVTLAAAEVGIGAKEILEAASGLSDQSKALNTEVENFISNVRVA